jgi:4-alpha-glucanotransferase
VAILPVLSALLDRPFDPSPYSPASRLFWNELYLDVEAVPELKNSPPARRLLDSATFRRTLTKLRQAERIDYPAVYRAKHRVLSLLATAMSAERRAAFEAFVADHPAVEDYAAFRAATTRFDRTWPAWPAGQRDGRLSPRDGDPADRHYHSYVQFLAFEQLQALRNHRASLHLDLPLGVHPDGYDVWRHREAFAAPGTRGGAPPDSFFTKGQDWGFPPLHPERIRDQRYAYPIACFRALMRHAGIVRIDHVMALHRLFWIPEGLIARDGVYVKYRPDELYAILSLESHRHRTTVVGEDLGTVPRAIRSAMAGHGVHRTYVAQLESKPVRPLPPVQRLALASVNTHDMAPFAAYWDGKDIDDRLSRDLLDQKEARAERTQRGKRRKALVRALRSAGHLPRHGPAELPAADVLPALLAWLGASEARVVLASLEDLWGETEPQNRPGTSAGANWSRRARHRLEEFDDHDEITRTLMRLAEFRVGSEP